MRFLAFLASTILMSSLLAIGAPNPNPSAAATHGHVQADTEAQSTLSAPNDAPVILGDCKIVAGYKMPNQNSPIECRESGGWCAPEAGAGFCRQHFFQKGILLRLNWWRATGNGALKCLGCSCRQTMWHERTRQDRARWLVKQGLNHASGGRARAAGNGLIGEDFVHALLGNHQP